MNLTLSQARAFFKDAGLKLKTEKVSFQDLARADGLRVYAVAPGRGPVGMADREEVAEYQESGLTWATKAQPNWCAPAWAEVDAMASLLLAWLRSHTIDGMMPF